MKQSIIYIEWEDSAYFSGWKDKKVASGCASCRVKSTGFLLKKDKKDIVIYQSRSDSREMGHIMAIPMSAVRKIKEL